jgi:hypothetical protein
MPARIILLIVTCLVSASTFAQPTEDTDLPDVPPTPAGSDNAPSAPVPPAVPPIGPVLSTASTNGECNGGGRKWKWGNRATGQRGVIFDGCYVEKMVGIITGGRGLNSLTEQDQALIEQIEEATKLLDDARSYAEELDAELAAIRSSKESLLAAIDSKDASTRMVSMHNRIVKASVDTCSGYMTRIETMFGELLELEENLDFVRPAARAALIAASTEIIMELEITRAELSAKWAELQGLHVYE